MANTYTVDLPNMRLTTATCSLVGDNIHTNNDPYEVIIADLCKCMLEAIELDDVDGKQAVAAALHIVLTSVLS